MLRKQVNRLLSKVMFLIQLRNKEVKKRSE